MIKSLQEFVRRLLSLSPETEAQIAFKARFEFDGRISSEHGILSEYCLHDICGCGKEINCDLPKLVVPISNPISQCENMFLKSLNASGTEFDKNHQYGIIVCGGIYHDQPIRKILKSEDMNVVLLASLKLIDASGSIDVVIPDLPSVWSIKDI
ncbi:hypothetical protein Tco_0630528 [Tanacetum coccineum]